MKNPAKVQCTDLGIEELIGAPFRDPSLLRQALTHRSHGNAHNERLEFLGDAVLQLLITELLFAHRPALSEGSMTRMRARLVRRDSLVAVARRLDLGSRVLLGEGEHRSGGRQRESILANALEAVIGAVFADSGLEAARSLVKRLFDEPLARITADPPPKDPKTTLQEWLQSRGVGLPEYRVVETSGPPHRRLFVVECAIPAFELRRRGESGSRRAAEQKAAQDALDALSHER